jgi:hypothetical protein
MTKTGEEKEIMRCDSLLELGTQSQLPRQQLRDIRSGRIFYTSLISVLTSNENIIQEKAEINCQKED